MNTSTVWLTFVAFVVIPFLIMMAPLSCDRVHVAAANAPQGLTCEGVTVEGEGYARRCANDEAICYLWNNSLSCVRRTQ